MTGAVAGPSSPFSYNPFEDEDPEMAKIQDGKKTIRRGDFKEPKRPSILPNPTGDEQTQEKVKEKEHKTAPYIFDMPLACRLIEALSTAELEELKRHSAKVGIANPSPIKTITTSAFTKTQRPSTPSTNDEISLSHFLPNQVDAPPLIELEKKPYNVVDISDLPSTHDLFNQYDVFNTNEDNLFATSDKILFKFNQMCPSYYSSISDTDKYKGFAEEISVPTDSRIVIKADIHGSWETFKTYIEKLKNEGYLDDNLRCKEGINITFLGDFTGRGNNDLFITNFIAMMKLQQPEQVHILKGNHEEKSYIKKSQDPDSLVYKYFSSSEERKNLINCFSDNLAIAMLFHENNYDNYLLCAHGVIDPTVNLNSLIKNPKTNVLFLPSLTLENFLSYRNNVSLYNPDDDSTYSKKLWSELFQKRAKYFEINTLTSEHQNLSSCTWGTILPKTSYFYFNNTPARYSSDISCSYEVLNQLAKIYSISFMYFGHAHYHQEFLKEKEGDQLQVKVLTWELSEPPYELDAAVALFTNGEILEFPMQTFQTTESIT